MKGKKIKRFAEISTFPNVHEHTQFSDERENGMRGNWSEVFDNNNPIVLELACGKGEYTLALSELFPEKNIIGIDIKGNRIWKGAKTALDKNIKNVAFLRIEIEKLSLYFEKEEVDEIWITFPDPFLKKSKSKKRLTSPRFLGVFRRVLKRNGLVHLKTDSDVL
ncbi:MAG: tRNA (guanosine(46)-N7)-methyltransferase TrmB, partial [Bacteroidetes bacterium]|nr:tRNA (guanosine(46)-N7)-methyltransferase TrmB [Bacteroidota bacterium]